MSMPRASTQGISTSKSRKPPPPIELLRHCLIPNILGDYVAAHRPQSIKQDIWVNLTRTRGGADRNM